MALFLGDAIGKNVRAVIAADYFFALTLALGCGTSRRTSTAGLSSRSPS
jgi:hypothetical protein